MGILRLNAQCITCLLQKHVNKYPPQTEEETKLLYMQRALKTLSEAKKEQSAPEVLADIVALQKAMFGAAEDFSREKTYFNALMLEKAAEISSEIAQANDAFYLAACYAMLGNFIDFGAMERVEEDKLHALLADAKNMQIDKAEIERLQRDLAKAKHLVYLTDNCGEIVFDKLLIETIMKMQPDLQIDVIVRGAPVLNDATVEDARQVGLDKLVPVIGNGTAIAGTVPGKISDEAREKLERADVVIAKGQGNFETLRYCGKNIYYLFMCKCAMFAERFGVERFSPMVLNDMRMQ